MNKAQIKVELNQLLTIDNVVYHVAEHPSLPGVPYVQRGARGFVIQLQSPTHDKFALKYFKLKYRVPELAVIGKALKRYAELPGMRAAARTVFTAQSHPVLVRNYPPLEYGMLMPWIPGVTWFDLVTRRVIISGIESLQWAQHAAQTLAALEEAGLAHCDIAGANVMIERAAGRFSLVDIEEMYGPGLPHPVELPAGQDGYQHQASAQSGQWVAEGDRFGGAVLIAELLCWHTPAIRQNSADEHYFAAAEMQQPDSSRYKLIHDVLQTEYSPAIADLFELVWRSATLRDCPQLSVWRTELDALAGTTNAVSAPSANTQPVSPMSTSGSTPIVTGHRMLTPALPPNPIPAPPTPVDMSASTDSASAANTALPTPPARPSIPATIKLCPNCGAQNPVSAEFCSQCKYYLRGSRRPAASVLKNKATAITTSTPINPTVSTGSATPPSISAPPIVSARRLVTPGQPGQVVPTVTPPPPEATDGRWIIIAVVIGFLITAIILALLSASAH